MFVREFLGQRSVSSQRRALEGLKQSLNWRQESRFLSQLRRQQISPLVFGSLRARSATELIRNTDTTFYSGDPFTEVRWLFTSLIPFAPEISEHIRFAAAFSSAFLRGDYADCGVMLEGYLDRFGATFWYIEKCLLLADQSGGLTESLRKFDQLVDGTKGITWLAIYYLSEKTQRRNSLARLRARVVHFGKGGNDKGISETGAWLGTIVLNDCAVPANHLAGLGFLLGRCAIQDRYILATRLLRSIFHANSELYAEVVPIADELNALCAAKEDHEGQRSDDDPLRLNAQGGVGIEEIADLYSTRANTIAVEKLTKSIKQNVPELKQVGLLSRVLNTTGLGDVSNLDHPLGTLVDVVRRWETPGQEVPDLGSVMDRILVIAGDSKLANGIRSFQGRIVRGDNVEHGTVELTSGGQIARDFEAYAIATASGEANALRVDFRQSQLIGFANWTFYQSIALADEALAESDILKAHNYYLGALAVSISSPQFVSPVRRCFRVLALYASQDCDLGPVLKVCASLHSVEPRYLDPTAIRFLASKVEGPRVAYNDFCERPLILVLAGASTQSIHFACADYFASQRIERPRDLIARYSEHLPPNICLFLRLVCTRDVLAESVVFDSTDELETERLAICRYLREHDKCHTSGYDEEIKSLTDSIAIRRGLQQIAKSRIYVDESGIRKTNATRYRDLVTRLKDSLLFDKVLGIKIPSSELGISAEDGKKAKLVVVQNPGFDAFAVLFRSIRDDFVLSNEFGLDSYLSVRIRHGVLLGQLRRPFEKQQLITKRSAADGYLKNEVWRTRLGELGPAASLIQGPLAQLSEMVDRIIGELNGSWLRVCTENSVVDGAYFNFNYDRISLLSLFSGIDPAAMADDLLVDFCFKELWQRTEQSLELIRCDLREVAVRRFLDALETTEHALLSDSTSTVGELSELLFALRTCKTEIQNEVAYISSWFRPPTQLEDGNFDVLNSLQIARRIIQDLNPKLEFAITVDVMSVALLPNKTFTTFVDIFLLLFDNAAKHSDLADGSLRIAVSGHCTTESLTLEFCSVPQAQRNLEQDVRAAQANWELARSRSASETIRKEGGSGIHKLFNLVRNKLNSSRGDIGFRIGEPRSFAARLYVPSGISNEGVNN